MRQRSERMNLTMSKWISKLKKIWNSHSAFDTIRLVKETRSRKWHRNNDPIAVSYTDLKSDRYGVMLRNTRTINRKYKDMKETRKRNLSNRQIDYLEYEVT